MTTNYRMPAEWEPHAATWLAWPHRRSDWPGKFNTVAWIYGEIVRTIADYEPVNLIVRDTTQQALVERVLKAVHANRSQIHLHTIPTDRSWVRDSGPIFVHDSAGKIVALDWHFNAWAKYPDWPIDDALPASVATILNCPRIQPSHASVRIVLEGGSIDVNGAGLLLTTEECLLSKVQERNPGLGRADYEAVFAEYLGIKKVLWLNRGIVGDDTHGHVDDLARFVNENTILLAVEKNPDDENYEPLQENLARLKTATGLNGTPLKTVALPMPRPLTFKGQRLPASYANFYIANNVVIVPTFNDPADGVALAIIAEQFPTRTIVGIHSVDLVWGLGTLHCLSQQQPASRS